MCAQLLSQGSTLDSELTLTEDPAHGSATWPKPLAHQGPLLGSWSVAICSLRSLALAMASAPVVYGQSSSFMGLCSA